MREVTDATFAAEVLEAGKPVVVDFWAPWCGPCHALAPVLEELAREHDARIDVVKLNVDENFATASRYGVLSLPTTILFAGGEARATVLGARPRSHFERAFTDWLDGPAAPSA
ncbi:MAG: thioredoxin [Actinomycetota bacterium]|nr:thioredoxin [Actinomycetota bacterium]